MVKKVVIVGAGASGLLLAHYLLRRDEECQIEARKRLGNPIVFHSLIEIYEQYRDPRTISVAKSKTFPIALNDRGMNAIAKIPGLTDAVKAISVEMSGTIIHTTSGKKRSISRKKSLTTLDRTELIKVFLNTLAETYDSDRLKIHFEHSCTRVDLAAKQAHFSTPKSAITVDYDLVVGADGARSQVRKAFQDTKLFELEQKYISNDYKSIYLSSGNDSESNPVLESGKIHSWRIKDGTVVLLLHQYDGSMAGVIHFPRENNQIVNLKTEAEARQFFKQNFPQVGQLMTASEASAFLARPIATTLTICCNRYHYRNSALLIGDAAHAVSPSLGQGCNAALEDVTVLNRLLNEYADNLDLVLEQFTKQRLADAHAVVELSNYTLPFARNLFLELILRQRLAKILHRLFPQRFLPPLFEAMHESSIAYRDIFKQYKGWCNKVKNSRNKSASGL